LVPMFSQDKLRFFVDMNIELRITDPGIPVTLHSCRHTTPIFCAETLANFELEFYC
jgi:hypothetical protein